MPVTTDSEIAPVQEQAQVTEGSARQSSMIYVWLATVPVIWGFNFVCLKILYSDAVGFTVPAMLSGRYIVMAVSFFVILLVLNDRERIAREDWKYLIGFALIAPTSIIATPWGVKLAHSIPPLVLKRAFAVFLAITSARMFWSIFT